MILREILLSNELRKRRKEISATHAANSNGPTSICHQWEFFISFVSFSRRISCKLVSLLYIFSHYCIVALFCIYLSSNWLIKESLT